MKPPFIRSFLAFCSLLIPVLLLVGYLHFGGWVYRSGITLSCLLLVVGIWFLRSRTHDLVYIMLAFLFSMGGDAVLGHYSSRPIGFVAGIVLFLIAHLCYIRFCLFHGSPHRTVFLFFLAVFLGYYAFFMLPAISPWLLSLAVLVYILVSILSLSAACGVGESGLSKWVFVAGIASLLFSDFLISLSSFMGIYSLKWLIMPTYFASQLLVTASLLSPKRD